MKPEEYLDKGAFICHRLSKGDESALKLVYELFGRNLFIYAFRITNDKCQAEDIVSESFIKLWKSHGVFQNLSEIKAFLITISKNSCLNYLKHEKRKSATHKEILYLNKIFNYKTESKKETELLQIVYQEAQNLPHLAKKIFAMIYIDGLSTEEVSDLLGIPKQNVRNNKSRALEMIRGMITKKLKGAFINL